MTYPGLQDQLHTLSYDNHRIFIIKHFIDGDYEFIQSQAAHFHYRITVHKLMIKVNNQLKMKNLNKQK